jgi:hypothetical protein
MATGSLTQGDIWMLENWETLLRNILHRKKKYSHYNFMTLEKEVDIVCTCLSK